jgi:3-hydroxyacyl-[acyl-carrier-protein] dehydratase
MPVAPLVDLSALDLSKVLFTREQIYDRLPQRYEFMQLDTIVHVDREQCLALASREVREDEYWVRGHIPGRPLLPGVLMIESAAQLAAFVAYELGLYPPHKFIGFGGVDNVKFRAVVSPPAHMYFALKGLEFRPRRIICDTQAFVNGQMCYEGRIMGMPF